MVLGGNILDMKKKRIDCDSVHSVCYTNALWSVVLNVKGKGTVKRRSV
jgi:hypothetical protein